MRWRLAAREGSLERPSFTSGFAMPAKAKEEPDLPDAYAERVDLRRLSLIRPLSTLVGRWPSLGSAVKIASDW